MCRDPERAPTTTGDRPMTDTNEFRVPEMLVVHALDPFRTQEEKSHLSRRPGTLQGLYDRPWVPDLNSETPDGPWDKMTPI